MTLEDTIRTAVREAVAEAMAEHGPPGPVAVPDDEAWRSRIHRVHPDTRLGLREAGEALNDVSERSVRRYMKGSDNCPPLPHARGPSGITIRAGDLVRWLEDVEEGERWRGPRRERAES